MACAKALDPMDSRAISAVVGMFLILAVLASVVTVLVVYKLPVMEKREEFRHEKALLDRFFELRKSYMGDCYESFELGSSPLPFLSTHESSSLRVWRCGEVDVKVYNGTSLVEEFLGRLFGYNLSVYPSRLPYVKAVLTPLGTAIYQGGFRLNLSNETELYINSIVVNSTVLKVYVDNYSVNDHLENFTISGTGQVFVSVSSNSTPGLNLNATRVIVTVSSVFGKRSVVVSAGGKVKVYYRNYSVYVW